MRVTRYVPLGPGLQAAADATDHSAPRGTDAFHAWYNEPRIRGRSVLDYAGLTVTEVADLLPGVPDTPIGRVWKHAVQISLSRTVADVDRPFDEVCYDTAAERDACAALGEFAEALRETSPLLAEVADAVDAQVLAEPFDLDDLTRERARITAEGITLGRTDEGWCDKHQDHCYATHGTRVARWEHLEALAPGTEATVRGLLATLDAGLPPVGEADWTARRGDPAA